MTSTTGYGDVLPELKKTPETAQEYQRMRRLAEGYKIMLAQPRCVTCGNFVEGRCDYYAVKVPQDQLYKIIDCENYDDPIPF